MNTFSSPATDAPVLQVRDVTKAYGGVPALRGVSMELEPGAIMCLLGPSGCGKTTLLRVIAGLEHADAGDVVFAGRSINAVPPFQRGFGLMFQDYALFPHRNVAENVAFGLRMQRAPKSQIQARVAEMLDLVGMRGYETRRVYELSGGERQRVALARALAPRPRLLMLDEPLGALDRALRERLLDELRVILKEVGVSSVYVTHDQAEAYAIADWLVLLNNGLIEQQGTPEAMYRQPGSLFAARFFGFGNLVEGIVQAVRAADVAVDTALGRLVVRRDAAVAEGQPVHVVLRPEAAILAHAAGPNQIAAVVRDRSFRGGWAQVAVQAANGQALVFDLDSAVPLVPGERVTLQLNAERLSVIARGKEEGKRKKED